MKIGKAIRWGIAICLFPLTLPAQNIDIARQYQQEVGIQGLLYQGKLEKSYALGYANSPYYPTEYTTGKLTYRGLVYQDIPLLLNIEYKYLVMQSPDRKYSIILSPEAVPRATIGAWDYVYLGPEDHAPYQDYYIAVYESPEWSIYKQFYISNINKQYEGSRMYLDFSIKERVYLKKDGRWTTISSRNDFIKHFRQYRTQLVDYCKKNRLRPGDKREEDWRKLAQYCNELTTDKE